MDVTSATMLQFLSAGGATGMLLIMVWLFLKGTIISKGSHEEVVKSFRDQNEELRRQVDRLNQEKDQWRDMARLGSDVIPRVVNAIEQRKRDGTT